MKKFNIIITIVLFAAANIKAQLSNVLTIVLIAVAIAIAPLSISFAQKMKSIEPNTPVKLNGFTVTSPSEDDWEYAVSKDKSTVNFILGSSNILTGSQSKTFISVFKDSVLIETEFSRKQLAEKLLEENLNAFKSAGFKNLQVKGKKLLDTTIAERRFYGMEYSGKFTLPDWNVWTYYSDKCFICFSGDSTNARQYFVFQISYSLNTTLGSTKINSAEFKPIFSMLKSFKYDEAAVQKAKK